MSFNLLDEVGTLSKERKHSISVPNHLSRSIERLLLLHREVELIVGLVSVAAGQVALLPLPSRLLSTTRSIRQASSWRKCPISVARVAW